MRVLCLSDLCPPLTSPGNGIADCSTPGVCNFTCDTGYTVSGSAVRRCQRNGTWSGTQPTCIQGNKLLQTNIMCVRVCVCACVHVCVCVFIKS